MMRFYCIIALILIFEGVMAINNKISTGKNDTKPYVTGVNRISNRGTIRFKADIPENSEKYHDILVSEPPDEEIEKEKHALPITDQSFKLNENTENIKDIHQLIPMQLATKATTDSKPLPLYLTTITKIEEVGDITDNPATIAVSKPPFGASNLDLTDYFEPSETDVFSDSAPRVAYHGDQKKRINFQDDQKENSEHQLKFEGDQDQRLEHQLIFQSNQNQKPEHQLIFEDDQKDRLQQQFTLNDDRKGRQPHQLIFKDDQKDRPQPEWTFKEETDKRLQNQLNLQDNRNHRKQKKLTFQDDKNLSPPYQLTFQEDNQSPSQQLIFQDDDSQKLPHNLPFQQDDSQKQPHHLTFHEGDSQKQPHHLTFQQDDSQKQPQHLNFQEDQYQRPYYQQTHLGQVPVAQHQPIQLGQITGQATGQKNPQRKRRRKHRQYFYGMEEQTKPLMVVQDVLSMLVQNDKKKCMLKLFCDQAHEITSQPQYAANSLRGAIDSVLYITKMLPTLTQKFGDNIGKLGSAMAAFMEAASTGRTSGVQGCRKAYPDCPEDPVEMANYIATFNGGFTKLFNGENYTYNAFNPHQQLQSNQVGLQDQPVGISPVYSGQYGSNLTPGQHYHKNPPSTPQYAYGAASNYHQSYQPNWYQPQPQVYQPNNQQSYNYHPHYQQGYQYNHKQGYQPEYQQDYHFH